MPHLERLRRRLLRPGVWAGAVLVCGAASFVLAYALFDEGIVNARVGFGATVAGLVVGVFAWLWSVAKADEAERDAEAARAAEKDAVDARTAIVTVVNELARALRSKEEYSDDRSKLTDDVVARMSALRGLNESPAEIRQKVVGSFRKPVQGATHLMVVFKDGDVLYRHSTAGGAARGGEISRERPPSMGRDT